MNGMEKLSPKEVEEALINEVTADILKSYLQYCQALIEASMNRTSMGGPAFKEIDDDLVVKPYELIDLIDEIQKALKDVD